jgi:CHAD domain-containing protein
MNDPIQKILLEEIHQIRVNSSKMRGRYNAGTLHDLRVASLRLRFALKFFASFIESEDLGGLRTGLKMARGTMGKVRNLDILSSHLEKDVHRLKPSLKEGSRIRKILQSMKGKARQSLVAMLSSAPYKKLLSDLKRTISYRNKKRVRPGDLLNKAFKLVAWRKNISKPKDFHRVRRSLKDLRYACEFLTVFHDTRKLRRKINDVIDLQDILGEYQDARSSVRILERMGRSPVIDGLSRIEMGRAGKALKTFKKRWKVGKSRKINTPD